MNESKKYFENKAKWKKAGADSDGAFLGQSQAAVMASYTVSLRTAKVKKAHTVPLGKS